MRINDISNRHFQVSVAGKKTRPEEEDKQRGHGDKPVELRVTDILDITGKVPKLSGHLEDGKFFLDVPEELKNRKLESLTGVIIDGVDYKLTDYPGVEDAYSLLDGLKTKYQYGAARKTDISERLADKEQIMWEIAAIAQKFNISDDERKDFMKQMQALADDYTSSYSTTGDSKLLNINNDIRRDSYYQNLFTSHFDAVNHYTQVSGTLFGYYQRNVETSVARYGELRDEILKAFEDDKDLLDKNLKSLDTAFGQHLERVALSNARHLESERIMARAAKTKGEEPLWESNKLALQKSFNMDKFADNAKNLMQQFVQEVISQIKNGSSYNTAMNKAAEMITRTTKTTSINELSFSDYMILDARPTSNATTREGNIIARDNQSRYFNNNPNLSEELRKLLNAA